MEAQFEIVSRLEKKHYVQWYRYALRKRILWVVIMGVIGTLNLTIGALIDDRFIVLYGCFCIGHALWNYFRPWIMAGKQLKKELNFEGAQVLASVTTFADEIRDVTKNNITTVPYDKIKIIHITKNTILLEDIRGAVLIMDKDGFTKGTYEEFLQFIQHKCPQLNLPKW